jgi:hypothetical protein
MQAFIYSLHHLTDQRVAGRHNSGIRLHIRMTRVYTSIGNWCIDAHGVTASELPQNVAELRRAAIARFTGKPAIIEIA